jgi:hypothetical protein
MRTVAARQRGPTDGMRTSRRLVPPRSRNDAARPVVAPYQKDTERTGRRADGGSVGDSRRYRRRGRDSDGNNNNKAATSRRTPYDGGVKDWRARVRRETCGRDVCAVGRPAHNGNNFTTETQRTRRGGAERRSGNGWRIGWGQPTLHQLGGRASGSSLPTARSGAFQMRRMTWSLGKRTFLSVASLSAAVR